MNAKNFTRSTMLQEVSKTEPEHDAEPMQEPDQIQESEPAQKTESKQEYEQIQEPEQTQGTESKQEPDQSEQVENKPKVKAGRPKKRTETCKQITVILPVRLIEKWRETNHVVGSMNDYVIRLIEHDMRDNYDDYKKLVERFK